MPTVMRPRRTPTHRRVTLSVATLALLTLTGLAAAQTPDMKQADRTYREGAASYGAAMAAREKGDAEAADAGFATAVAKLTEAQRLLRRDLHRYRYAEALSLRALGRLDAAWAILNALADQGDEPEVATQARTTVNEILTGLDKEGHGLIELDCTFGGVEVRVTRRADSAATSGTAVATRAPLDRWVGCRTWADPQMLTPGRYAVHLRSTQHTAGDAAAVELPVELAPGAHKLVLVHYAIAPTPPVYIQGGGCGGGAYQRVEPATAPITHAVVDRR